MPTRVRYLDSYANAIRVHRAPAQAARHRPRQRRHLDQAVSALHPRYEDAQRERVLRELVPRVWQLCELAARCQPQPHDRRRRGRPARAVARRVRGAGRARRRRASRSGAASAWRVQAYQTRALELVDARRRDRAQAPAALHVPPGQGRVLGRRDQARAGAAACRTTRCSRTSTTPTSATWPARARCSAAPDAIYPQFATHNAGTIAAILQMARAATRRSSCSACTAWARASTARCMKRTAAPVPHLRAGGPAQDLLAYLVRRLLENGANSSFVHQLADDVGRRRRAAGLAAVARARCARCRCRPRSTAPPPARRNSSGVDLAVESMRAPLLAAHAACTVPAVAEFDAARAADAVARLRRPASQRGARRRSRSAPPCCAAPPTRSTPSCRASARLLVKEALQDLGRLRSPRCARRSTSCATTPTRPSASCGRRCCPARPARATSCA